MFQKTKQALKDLKERYDYLESQMNNMANEWLNYLEWKKQRDANEEASAKMGHFYITADDSALLERLIQEVNKDPDLAVLLTTAQGTTLTLRSHPQPEQKRNSLLNKFTGGEE